MIIILNIQNEILQERNSIVKNGLKNDAQVNQKALCKWKSFFQWLFLRYDIGKQVLRKKNSNKIFIQ